MSLLASILYNIHTCVCRHFPNKEQYQWIAYVLLWKLIDSKSFNVDHDIQCNIQMQFDCIQIRNAIELCDNVPDCLHKVFLVELIFYDLRLF